MLLRSHRGGNCSGDGGAHEGGPDLHPTGLVLILKTLVYTTYMGVSHALHYLNELQVLKVEDGK